MNQEKQAVLSLLASRKVHPDIGKGELAYYRDVITGKRPIPSRGLTLHAVEGCCGCLIDGQAGTCQCKGQIEGPIVRLG